jgi:hypothetical protein
MYVRLLVCRLNVARILRSKYCIVWRKFRVKVSRVPLISHVQCCTIIQIQYEYTTQQYSSLVQYEQLLNTLNTDTARVYSKVQLLVVV